MDLARGYRGDHVRACRRCGTVAVRAWARGSLAAVIAAAAACGGRSGLDVQQAPAHAGAGGGSQATSTSTSGAGSGPMSTSGAGGGATSCPWQGPAALWNKGFGDECAQTGTRVVPDAEGNIILVGSMCGYVDFGGGLLGVDAKPESVVTFAAKYDATGTYLWSLVIGEAGATVKPRSLDVGPDGSAVIAGSFVKWYDLHTKAEDTWVAKLASDGSQLWAHAYVGYRVTQFIQAAIHGTGDVFISLLADGYIDLGGGTLYADLERDAFLAKLDASGNHIWSKNIGGPGHQNATSFALTTDGLIITGTFDGTVDLGGMVLTTAGSDVYVAKLDFDGNEVWARQYPFSSAVDAPLYSVIAVDPFGRILLAGPHPAGIDFGGGPLVKDEPFLVKLDAAGNHIFSKTFTKSVNDYFFSFSPLATDGSGNIMLTGQFQASLDLGGGPLVAQGMTDAFIAKLDPAGQHIWSRRAGEGMLVPGKPSLFESGRGVAVDPTGHLLWTGQFSERICLGLDPVEGKGDIDAFLVKLPP